MRVSNLYSKKATRRRPNLLRVHVPVWPDFLLALWPVLAKTLKTWPTFLAVLRMVISVTSTRIFFENFWNQFISIWFELKKSSLWCVKFRLKFQLQIVFHGRRKNKVCPFHFVKICSFISWPFIIPMHINRNFPHGTEEGKYFWVHFLT